MKTQIAEPRTPPSSPDPNPIRLLNPRRSLRGKIARLPKALRDQINQILDDGFSYRAIIQTLKDAGTEFPKGCPSQMDISRWKDNGYQRYLKQQERLADVRANREASLEVVADGDTTTIAEADLQISASQYYDLLDDLQTPVIRQKIAEDPLQYPRFLNAFARLTREMLKLKTYRDLRADLKEREAKLFDPKQPIVDEQTKALAVLFDRAFRMTHPDFLQGKQALRTP